MYEKEIVLLKGLKAGYCIFRDTTHPLAYNEGVVYLHRHVASITCGRWLSSDEHVHHIDENKLNNSPENLQVLSASEHSSIHNPTTEFGKDDRCLEEYICEYCGSIFHPFRTSLTKKFCSQECYNRNKIKNKEITKELLNELIPKYTWIKLGEMFGYSDGGIRKRAKALGCNIPLRRPAKGEVM